MYDLIRVCVANVVAAALLTVAGASNAQDRVQLAQFAIPEGVASHSQDRDAGTEGKQRFERCRQDQARCRGERRGRMTERFRSADSNRDGAISQAEAQARMPRLNERFSTIDANGDGLVTREEMQDRARAGREVRGAR